MSKKPIISLIAAMAHRRIIGKDNAMPWHLPADLAHFKKMTLGKPIVMGRKTFESLGRPLPGRRNIVISRQKNRVIENVECFDSLEKVLALLKNEAEIMIIGGASLYEQTLMLADQLYLTYIEMEVEGDAFFPNFDEKQYRLVQREAHGPDEKNSVAYEFLHFVRKSEIL